MNKFTKLFLIGLFLFGGWAGYSINSVIDIWTRPYCPTEDSCSPDYNHGHPTWREVTP